MSFLIDEELDPVTSGAKGMDLFINVKQQITNSEQVPAWVNDVIGKIKALPDHTESVLLSEEEQDEEEDLPF